jgi:bisanhydrobacterioruberin hydratase
LNALSYLQLSYWQQPLQQRAAAWFCVVVYVSGIIGMQSAFRDWFIAMTPLSLLLSAAVLWQHQQVHFSRTYSWAVGAYTIGLGSEIIGVNTGWLFGEYAYGDVLGPKIWHTPLLIGINWYLVTAICNEVTWRILPHRSPLWVGAALAAAGCTALDYLIEPGAIALGYWSWAEGLPPLKNYTDWWLVSFVISLGYATLMRPALRNAFAPWLLVLQVLFFGVLNVRW